MQSNPMNTRAKIIFVLIGLALIGSVVYIATFTRSNSSDETKPVPTNSARTPAEDDVAEPEVVYAGLSTFLQRGLLRAQVDATQIAVDNFAASQNKKPKKITFANIKHYVGEQPDGNVLHEYLFDLSLDSTKYRGKIHTVTNSSIRLYVLDAADQTKQLYDSRVIDTTSQTTVDAP